MFVKFTKAAVISLFAFVFVLLAARADTQLWSTRTGDWFIVDNWTNTTDPGNTRVPVAGDDVVVTSAAARVLLTNSTEWLSSLLISNATVSCSNWDTTLYVTNLTILKSGVLTCEGPFTNNAVTNRVSLNCVTLFIETNGSINVDSRGYSGGLTGGYAWGHGPGGSRGYWGASYGGAGLDGSIRYDGLLQCFATNTYGSPTAPLDPGSGGNAGNQVASTGGIGGGAICITALQVVVNGTITANGGPTSGGSHNGGGSGGGIYITCSIITGTNGSITANAGLPNIKSQGGGAGGGRIAVIYDQASQAALPVPALRFSAASSVCGGNMGYTPADIGTLYFPDSYFFSPTNLFTGQWLAPGLTNLALSDWVFSNAWLRLPGINLTVTNTFTIAGTNYEMYRLEFTNAATINCGRMDISGASLRLGNYSNPYKYLYHSSTSGSTLTCSGDLTLTNTSRFYVLAGFTNTGAEAGYGARVIVGNEIRILTNCWILPAAHPTNGQVVLFSMRNLTVSNGGGFNADYLGYSGGLRPGGSENANRAFGPGATNFNSGSGYGGQGSTSAYSTTKFGPVYGSSNAPVAPGSGAQCGYALSYSYNGANGGGSVQIRATDIVTVQGTITANGGNGGSAAGPGASGGGIYITCRRFIGDSGGILQANGGSSPVSSVPGGGGGGGRIAVWRILDDSPNAISNYVNGGGGYFKDTAPTNGATGGPGTIVWGWLMPPNGTVITVR